MEIKGFKIHGIPILRLLYHQEILKKELWNTQKMAIPYFVSMKFQACGEIWHNPDRICLVSIVGIKIISTNICV